MEESQYKVQDLNNIDKEFLLSKTPARLPDNPSDKGFSASQIKGKMYEGYLVLFEWLKRLISQVNTANTHINRDLESIHSFMGNPIEIESQDYVIPEEDR